MLKFKMVVAIVVLMCAVVGLLILGGCTSAGNAFVRSMGEVAVTQAVVSGVRNEIEGPRGTTVNVVQGGNNVAVAPQRQYVGQYKDGKYDGQGTLTFPDGRKYVGQFKDGKYNGHKIFPWASGTVTQSF